MTSGGRLSCAWAPKHSATAHTSANAVFNDTIEKIKQEVAYGYESLAIEQEKAKARQDAANAIEKANDEEAKSFTRSMGAGFDDLFKDIDYIYGRLGKDLPKQFRDGMVQALETSMDKAESFGDVMRNVAIDMLKTIRRASLESAASNFTNLIGMGVSSTFRNSGNQLGGLIKARNGMYISGNRSGDRNPALLEDGEYVLNKKAVQAVGGRAALDKLNFSMAPRFAEGGTFGVNESVDSPRMSGLFLASDNPELQESRDKAREAWEKKQQKKEEKKALKRQFISTLLSTAASGLVSAAGSRIQQRAEMGNVANAANATGVSPGATRTGNFFKGYSVSDAQGNPLTSEQLGTLGSMTSVSPEIASKMGIRYKAGAKSVELPKSFKRGVNKLIDERIEEYNEQGFEFATGKKGRKKFSQLYTGAYNSPYEETFVPKIKFNPNRSLISSNYTRFIKHSALKILSIGFPLGQRSAWAVRNLGIRPNKL